MKRFGYLNGVVLVGMGLLLSGCVEPDGFSMADVNEDEWVSQDEFEHYMLEVIFADADADGDAEVSFAEWRQVNPKEPKWKFQTPDQDGDNKIDPAELREHFEKQGTMGDLFQQIDTDGKGYLSRDEVTAFKERVMGAEGSTRLEKFSNVAKEGGS
ncbi:MAG: EF-hand domain-containing protein [Verrucomicrobiota bacterium]